jgi:hypothetical protein
MRPKVQKIRETVTIPGIKKQKIFPILPSGTATVHRFYAHRRERRAIYNKNPGTHVRGFSVMNNE